MDNTLTHKTYKEYIDLRNDGKIVMYKRNDHNKKPKWNVRIKVPNTNGYVVKSTKTMDFNEGKRFSEDLYYELEGKVRRGEVLKSPKMSRVISEWKKELPLVWRDRKQSYIDTTLGINRNHIEPYFKDMFVDQITEDSLVEYFNYKTLNMKPKPSSVTLRHQGTVLGNILRFSKRKGYITSIPNIPLPKLKQIPRPDFNSNEWKLLYTYMRKWVKEYENHFRIWRDRLYTQQMVLILGNSGVRVGELRNLRWIDIEEVFNIDGEKRISISVDGKTGFRNVICNSGVEVYLERIWNCRKKELGKDPQLTEYVFINNLTNKPITSFKGSWNSIMKGSGLQYDKDGNKRVPYSLRHTYVTMRLREGVNIYQLSNNIGSSVEMIENFYGKKRNKDPLNVSELTKSSTNKNPLKTKTNQLPWNKG